MGSIGGMAVEHKERLSGLIAILIILAAAVLMGDGPISCWRKAKEFVFSLMMDVDTVHIIIESSFAPRGR